MDISDTTTQRDHLFISYAAEDLVFAKWLARRLAAVGYAVWMDRLKMLGGESWLVDVDDAIRSRTFRMLAIVSRNSLDKPAPRRERTFAQRLAENSHTADFLIPLNLDGLSREELQWTLSDTCDIHFCPSWASGLQQLQKKLESVDTPRPNASGATVAAGSICGNEFLANDGEALVSNCLVVTAVPEVVHRFRLSNELTKDEFHKLKLVWPIHWIDAATVLAFDPPQSEVIAEFGVRSAGAAAWRDVEEIDGIFHRNVVVSLIHKSLDHLFATKGLAFGEKQRQWYFPEGVLPRNRLPYERLDGSRSHIDASGQRKFRNDSYYRHHLSPGFSVLPGVSDPFVLYLRNRVYLTDVNGVPFEGRSVNARRKHLCRNWWNDDWLARTLAICQFLSDSDGSIRVGSRPDSQIVIDARPTVIQSPIRLDESGAVDIPDEFRGREDDFEEESPIDGVAGNME